ncbi:MULTISPECIES: DUF4190 domain-containing protein [Subtercola]|uniref:DUF4190 domain-containing protein n=1 Tax=Subtercola vilae TaxID=2056433 RepID=A0A4V4RF95_9MICO|nr:MULTISPECIES: DUF4190 domain-containing protein [Subtercola]MEA9985050.1 DUF4190 domain-containing protein [Subtercola sp. RTI3]TIH37074.1 DUF4190 domain-containing protein [Subtercola vilae]
MTDTSDHTLLPAAAEVPSAVPLSVPNRGRTIGIVGFALSFFVLLNLAGLVLSIIALVKSRRDGFRNGFALAGIIIAGIGVTITLLIAAIAVPTLVNAGETCGRLGNGVHQVGNATYTCTPSSFFVSYH